MKRTCRVVMGLLLGVWIGSTGFSQEPADNVPSAVQDIDECVPPALDEPDDFYRVNPTLRQQYYEYMSHSLAPLIGANSRETEMAESDRLIFRGRFRIFITDLLSTNAKLVTTAREVLYLRSSPPERYKEYPVSGIFEDIDKLSGGLANRLSFLLPMQLDGQFDRNKIRRRYSEMARKGQHNAMITLLLHRVSAFERRFCNLLFPQTYTVSLDELAEHGTPLTDIQEIREIARALRRTFPKKGFPAGFHTH
ncbi:MAG TPA: hypothetical protein PKN61_03240 [Acidobacteriota bacterium]|nr:hypothetical protein [Acidobacteriota bacterium]HNR38027.1 hypothetical protein [Acidobacteriota bacterium]HNU00097.1 hypothetical protein [Acidobacteriota bacterium]HPB27153.1 hypothetical protein [Acidobacteriota bacterium]HQO25342.1 hypothetical protein [Acidobacteriota bacterium]